jgi:hypothetical protein
VRLRFTLFEKLATFSERAKIEDNDGDMVERRIGCFSRQTGELPDFRSNQFP